MHTALLIATELVAATHLIMGIVFTLYAFRSVAFSAQAWILYLTSIIYGLVLTYVAIHPTLYPLGMLHPVLLICLLTLSFLFSINPLGMMMPGYLQLERMVKYAGPAIAVVALYLVGMAAGSKMIYIDSAEDLHQNLLSGDVLLRLAALLLSFYYIANILLIPKRLIRKRELPNNVITYATLLGLVQLGLVFNAIWISYVGLVIYEVLFTSVSMMLCGCILNPLIQAQPYPQMLKVETPPTTADMVEAEEDFNEANLVRFEQIEYVMQHDKPYVAAEFTRDNLCRLAGFNRHVILEVLRSQGYNDVHDYISRYRVAELKRRILEGEITELRQHDEVGFKTIKTAASSFERYEHEQLSVFFERCQKAKA